MVKNPAENAEDIRDVDLIPGLGESLNGGMATHSSTSCLEKRTWTEKPGELQSIG